MIPKPCRSAPGFLFFAVSKSGSFKRAKSIGFEMQHRIKYCPDFLCDWADTSAIAAGSGVRVMRHGAIGVKFDGSLPLPPPMKPELLSLHSSPDISKTYIEISANSKSYCSKESVEWIQWRSNTSACHL